MTDVASGLIVLTVAVVSAVLAILGALGAQRTKDKRLWFVAGAFGVFALKGIITALSLWNGLIGHETLEILGSVMELTAVSLLVAPFLRR